MTMIGDPLAPAGAQFPLGRPDDAASSLDEPYLDAESRQTEDSRVGDVTEARVPLELVAAALVVPAQRLEPQPLGMGQGCARVGHGRGSSERP